MSDSLQPTNCSRSGFSVFGILHARILEWVAIFFSRGSSWPRDWNWTWVSYIASGFFTVWATREQSRHDENPRAGNGREASPSTGNRRYSQSIHPRRLCSLRLSHLSNQVREPLIAQATCRPTPRPSWRTAGIPGPFATPSDRRRWTRNACPFSDGI